MAPWEHKKREDSIIIGGQRPTQGVGPSRTAGGYAPLVLNYGSMGAQKKRGFFESSLFCAPSGARTLDPNIKSVVLYQLS